MRYLDRCVQGLLGLMGVLLIASGSTIWARQDCTNGRTTGWCAQSSATWDFDCDCDDHGYNWAGNPCSEVGPPAAMCVRRDCSKFQGLAFLFGCAEQSGTETKWCMPWNSLSVECPCDDIWECFWID